MLKQRYGDKDGCVKLDASWYIMESLEACCWSIGAKHFHNHDYQNDKEH